MDILKYSAFVSYKFLQLYLSRLAYHVKNTGIALGRCPLKNPLCSRVNPAAAYTEPSTSHTLPVQSGQSLEPSGSHSISQTLLMRWKIPITCKVHIILSPDLARATVTSQEWDVTGLPSKPQLSRGEKLCYRQ